MIRELVKAHSHKDEIENKTPNDGPTVAASVERWCNIAAKVHGELKPVAYVSCALTSMEQRYAQIEEALAIAWVCDKFNYCLAGESFVVETDHKPFSAV